MLQWLAVSFVIVLLSFVFGFFGLVGGFAMNDKSFGPSRDVAPYVHVQPDHVVSESPALAA